MDPLNVSEYRIQIDIKEIEERNRGEIEGQALLFTPPF